MARLKTRQERFCHQFVDCANASAAAKAAGYAPASARNTGYRLLCDPRIVERIAHLQAEIARAHCREVDSLLGKLETVYRRAIDNHQFSAAARAIELQAKLAGLADKPHARVAARDRGTTATHPAAAAEWEADGPPPRGPATGKP
jgi:hypothetical protein